MLHVFQHKGARFVVFDDVGDSEQQVFLLFALEPLLPSQTQFFRYTGDAEWLTGKARAQDVVRRNVCDRYFVNVAMRSLTNVLLVGLLPILAPNARPKALAAGALERNPKPADATE